MQRSEQIDAPRRRFRQPNPTRSHHAIARTEITAALQLQLAILVNKNAVTPGHTQTAPVRSLHLVELLLELVTNHGLDRPESHLVVALAEAEHLTEIAALT